ncbi:MAG: DUF1934 domain-containing protein [Lentilactobacillus diolivorans]|jgi:uncharacterized beta-barrel protein YwiB (DUF1934 family)|uniref:DUF1934 domain-containing protein n=1 Tax=Lentilactobacillus diolivorans TaxID=179838 RepID=UPI000FF65BA3|nr:DUF1934 domain-containing protein [Lentilactobacillus diolivorans]MCH4163828.1 DUF1934 domain-containing protein [Lentilactobacillus diolivorans]MDH5105352.1 DUF1934 domain-containing protein [Lentilactobacillus diolivorans]RRG01624.1 MAG: DUF1934 domain-containing protein [Lactobacillus sp.]
MDNLATGVPAQIHLETSIVQDGKTSDFMFDVTGQLVKMGTSIYIRYSEDADEGPVPVTIKIMENGDVKLTRSAQNRLQLLFSDGKRVAARYRTPYGNLDIQTVTSSLNMEILNQPLRGNIEIDYLLYAGNELLGKYHIRLQFTI